MPMVWSTLKKRCLPTSLPVRKCADDTGFAGVAYCAPDVMANGVWNLLMLWVETAHQRQGMGHALIAALKTTLASKHARLLLVETSSLSDFVAARAFYVSQGFVEEARIRDYYAPGKDKLIYTRPLSR